ncbi:hypothetical protein [Corynebacterium tuberculostearicum]|uniref:hypothetical protein n=1 Tax=Corynebacterium tuberculostearicum TaxID=38304 RepID=UPI0038D1CC47
MKLEPSIFFEHPAWQENIVNCDLKKADQPTAIKSLRINWGRDQFLDDHDPAILKFTFCVFDTAKVTTYRMMTHRASIPIRVEVAGLTIFRGFPRDIHARRTKINGRDVYIFDITAADETAKLGNHRPSGSGIQSWSSTRGDYGVDFINTMFKNLADDMPGIAKAIAPAGSSEWDVQIGHTDWSQATLHTYLTRYYRSAGGIGWDYNPDTKEIIPQGTGPESITAVMTWYTGQGVRIVPELENSSATPVVGLDGKILEVDDLGFSITPRLSLKTVKVKAYNFTDKGAIEKDLTLNRWGTDTTTVETMLAPRNKWDLSHYLNNFAPRFKKTMTATSLWPDPPSIRFRTKDLFSMQEVRYWFATYYTGIYGIIRNSAVLEWLQSAPDAYAGFTPPTVVPRGGQLEYDGEEWTIDQDLTILGKFNANLASVTYETLNERTARMKNYADSTSWSDFQILPQRNEFRS